MSRWGESGDRRAEGCPGGGWGWGNQRSFWTQWPGKACRDGVAEWDEGPTLPTTHSSPHLFSLILSTQGSILRIIASEHFKISHEAGMLGTLTYISAKTGFEERGTNGRMFSLDTTAWHEAMEGSGTEKREKQI